jgi:lactoylglutathione lyase
LLSYAEAVEHHRLRAGEALMTLGPIEAVRVFTSNLSRARGFYAGVLGLPEILATDAIAIFNTGQAKLIIEYIDLNDPEASVLIGRFTAFSFTVSNMERTLHDLRGQAIEWLSFSERQPWGGLLSHFKDPDGNVLTLAQYP